MGPDTPWGLDSAMEMPYPQGTCHSSFAMGLKESNEMVSLESTDAPDTRNPSSGQDLSERVYIPAIAALASPKTVHVHTQAVAPCLAASYPCLAHPQSQAPAYGSLHP